MAPFDGPALAAAQIRVEQINAKGGVNGRHAPDHHLRHAGQQARLAPRRARASCSARSAHVLFTTCDVDFAAPVVQASINRGPAHDRAVHRHRPDGPEALRREGPSWRSASATSRRTRARRWRSTRWSRGWKTGRPRAPTRVLVYFKNVVQAFEKRFKQLGGKIVAKESYAVARRQQRQHGGQPSERREGRRRTSTATAFERAAGVRHGPPHARQQHADPELLGRRRHVLAAEEPEGDELLLRHLRVRLRRRPEQGRSTRSRSRSKAGTGGFVHGRRGDRRRSSTRSSARTGRRTGRRSRRRWRSSRRCRRCRATSASRRRCTPSSGGSTA